MVSFTNTIPELLFQYSSTSSFSNKDLLRLHDKKIGGFAVNPNTNYQITTASLDRTLRIWDLRNVNKSIYSEFENQKSPPYVWKLQFEIIGFMCRLEPRESTCV